MSQQKIVYKVMAFGIGKRYAHVVTLYCSASSVHSVLVPRHVMRSCAGMRQVVLVG